ncbi:hypothetical protein GRO01_18590 [Gluconobacter roseus NBRC 3990]|uniref:Uncharacterized protein n=1 Tax=Gluconobacter roseus NBRC 3990 TaxID=1307950 RepID=A0A4Y3M6U1_9PROT|nr:hypothetical protein GRO01_18590 [Gluconobacter roseus NBRC 3990]
MWRGGQAQGNALFGEGEALHDPQGERRSCRRQRFVQGGLTLAESLAFPDHGGDVPGMVKGQAMIGKSQ